MGRTCTDRSTLDDVDQRVVGSHLREDDARDVGPAQYFVGDSRAVAASASSSTVLSSGTTLPPASALFVVPTVEPTLGALQASVAQLAMTVGNAALATAVLLSDFYDREVSPDELSTSMGLMNAAAVPFGGFPMCHGSGGVAGKYAFGARTAGANVVLGVGYLVVGLVGVGFVTAYPLAVLGVILALVAIQLGVASLRPTDAHAIVLGIGLLGLLVNLGVAFVVGAVVYGLHRRLVG